MAFYYFYISLYDRLISPNSPSSLERREWMPQSDLLSVPGHLQFPRLVFHHRWASISWNMIIYLQKEHISISFPWSLTTTNFNLILPVHIDDLSLLVDVNWRAVDCVATTIISLLNDSNADRHVVGLGQGTDARQVTSCRQKGYNFLFILHTHTHKQNKTKKSFSPRRSQLCQFGKFKHINDTSNNINNWIVHFWLLLIINRESEKKVISGGK